jgi:hypothetical protein
MRGSIARSFALSLALAYGTAGHQASAAPRPKPPPPPAQGTITISYFGAGSITETPSPEVINNSTLDLDYREVFRVTSGSYDKAAGTIDLVGSGTIAYQYVESGDSSVIRAWSCGFSGLWYTDEKSSGRYTAERSGTYATGVHRRGTMSSGSQGVLHIGRYPGSDLANPDWSTSPGQLDARAEAIHALQA